MAIFRFEEKEVLSLGKLVAILLQGCLAKGPENVPQTAEMEALAALALNLEQVLDSDPPDKIYVVETTSVETDYLKSMVEWARSSKAIQAIWAPLEEEHPEVVSDFYTGLDQVKIKLEISKIPDSFDIKPNKYLN